ncbi:MAG: hypothetical protein ACRD19_16065, partial [Terriglobia bacterium]
MKTPKNKVSISQRKEEFYPFCGKTERELNAAKADEKLARHLSLVAAFTARSFTLPASTLTVN